MTSTPVALPGFSTLAEPELLFHPTRQEDRDIHPLRGLLNYGPYSRGLVASVLDPIRVAGIVPHGYLPKAKKLLGELEANHVPRERTPYLMTFPGFSRLFGVRALACEDADWCELPAELEQKIQEGPKAHLLLAEHLTRALLRFDSKRSAFDVLLMFLPSTWQEAFHGGAEEDFDLHDHLKAATAARAIPLQLVREDRSLAYPCRCSVAWRLGIAIYCKAGGIPWRLVTQDEETAVVGISYAVRKGPRNGRGRFVTCCSQVFDADGTGLEFLLYEPGDVRLEKENPFLSRAEMRRVMSRSLSLYQRRHGGRAPKRVTIHKSTEFRPEEVDGCFDAWAACDGLELLQVQQDAAWRGILIGSPRSSSDKKGVPDNYPCPRGTCLQLGGRDILLWTQGNCREVTGGKNYYKEGKGIPSPLHLHRFAGHGGWERCCAELLGLTKMNWNNDGLYDRLPVTMSYAKVLARTVKRMSNLSASSYQFRFFI